MARSLFGAGFLLCIKACKVNVAKRPALFIGQAKVLEITNRFSVAVGLKNRFVKIREAKLGVLFRGRGYSFSIWEMRSTLFWWRPPSNLAFRNSSTIISAMAGPITLAPKAKMLASLCCLARRAL